MAGIFPLVAGLGNPGAEYAATRHNFGFMVLDRLAREAGAVWKQAGFANALLVRLENGVWLLKPLDYMNRSGVAIRAALDWFKLGPEHLLVVVDDVSLPLGQLRVRSKGSDGGHNGLGSIESSLGTQNFARLRGGVGAAEPGRDLADHVLCRFRKEEEENLENMILRALEALRLCETQGVESAAAKINSRL